MAKSFLPLLLTGQNFGVYLLRAPFRNAPRVDLSPCGRLGTLSKAQPAKTSHVFLPINFFPGPSHQVPFQAPTTPECQYSILEVLFLQWGRKIRTHSIFYDMQPLRFCAEGDRTSRPNRFRSSWHSEFDCRQKDP